MYLDAVFYPRLTRHTFEQEGWHYELEDEGDSLAYKGVVFNEMKGAYSSPDGVLEQHILTSLFPDTLYGLDSGGDPRKFLISRTNSLSSFTKPTTILPTHASFFMATTRETSGCESWIRG